MNNLFISDRATIGKGCKIYKYTQICNDAIVGDFCTIGHNVFIGEKVIIGSGCKIQGNVFIPEGIIIEQDTFIGPGTTFCNVKNPKAYSKSEYKKTYVRSAVVIGANCTILPGLEIGEDSVLGAGSVLTKSLPANITAYGNPAKIVA